MKQAPSNSVPGQVVLGIIVIGIGLLFLLDNLDIWDLRRMMHFWPIIFIIVGALKVMDTRSPNGYVVGGALILVGAAMLLHRLGYIYFSWRAMWPVLLIFLGASVVVQALAGRRQLTANVSLEKDEDAIVDVTAILGGFQRRIVSPNFRGGEVTAIMGGCELDLRHCAIAGEAVINVFALFGGITIKVPPDWSVVLQGTPILGGFDEKTIAPPDTAKRLLVKGYAIMGGLDVRN